MKWMKDRTLVGFYILWIVSTIDFFATIFTGKVFIRPLSLLPSLVLGFASTREIIRSKNK